MDHYSYRFHPGPKYKAAEETVIGDNPPGTTSFVLKTGNERGSNVVKVAHPA